MTKGRKAVVGKVYWYKKNEIKFDGTNWVFGNNIQRTLAACKRVIDANQSPSVAQSSEERISQ